MLGLSAAVMVKVVLALVLLCDCAAVTVAVPLGALVGSVTCTLNLPLLSAVAVALRVVVAPPLEGSWIPTVTDWLAVNCWPLMVIVLPGEAVEGLTLSEAVLVCPVTVKTAVAVLLLLRPLAVTVYVPAATLAGTGRLPMVTLPLLSALLVAASLAVPPPVRFAV
jgi:hypothetical protein